jgi:hypothetical protein
MHSTPADGVAFEWLYPLALVWGFVILLAFVGWGKTVARWLLTDGKKEDLGWGMESAYGMTTFLILSGPLLVLSIFSTIFVVFFLLIGLTFTGWHFYLGEKKIRWIFPAAPSLKALLFSLLLLIGLIYAGGVAAREYNCFDDFSAYFALVKMMLDTGTLYDPFSFRIVGTLGGQTALDTLILAFFPWKYAHMMDFSVAMMMMLGLIQSSIRGIDHKAWLGRLLLIALAVTLPVPHVNIASEVTGVVLFLAFLRSLNLAAKRSISGWRLAFLLGGIAAAAATLRAHNVFFMAAFGLAFMSWRFWEDASERQTIFCEALLTVAMAALFLAPWEIVGYRSCGVFLYPLIRGTHRPDFDLYNHHLSFVGTLQFIKVFFLSYYYLPFFIPLVFLRAGRERRQLWVLGAILAFMSVLFLSKMTFNLHWDIYRYLFPIGMAFGLYSAGVLTQQLVKPAPDGISYFDRWRLRLVVACVAFGIFSQSLYVLVSTYVNVSCIAQACGVNQPMWTDPHGLGNHAVYLNSVQRDYDQAFAQIPPGSKVLIALDYPFLLDYKKYRISTIDEAGAASPAPGYPYFKGAAPVKEYLQDQGIHYIVHVPFDLSDSLHGRLNQTLNFKAEFDVYHFFASYEKDFCDNVEQLATENAVLFKSPSAQVIDLQGKP